jgi:hypothetical protein
MLHDNKHRFFYDVQVRLSILEQCNDDSDTTAFLAAFIANVYIAKTVTTTETTILTVTVIVTVTVPIN